MPRRVVEPVDGLLRLATGGLRRMADVTASRLLEMDSLASQLALYAEAVVSEIGRERVTRTALLQSPLLDGSLLPILRAVLVDPDADFSPAELRAARTSLVDLLVTLEQLRAGTAPPTEGSLERRVEYLVESAPEYFFGELREALGGDPFERRTPRLLLASYPVFMQAILIRAIPEALQDAADALPSSRERGRVLDAHADHPPDASTPEGSTQ